MALILSFDTSGPYCTAALCRGGEVLAWRHEDMARGQAERLMPLLEEILAEADLAIGDIDALAVGIGPGNFTGIRLSVAAARGLSLALDIPAIGVSVLEAAAEAGPRPMLATRDARRGAVFVQRFEASGRAAATLVDDPATLPDDLVRIGSGPGAQPPALPLAVALARVARDRLATPSPRPAPLYIRPADAAPGRDVAPALLP